MTIIEQNLSIIQDLYNKGKNDVYISNKIKCSPETIRQWRIKNKLDTNFKYQDFRKIDIEVLKNLVKQNKKDSEIAKILNVSKDGIYSARIKNNILRPSFNISKGIKVNKFQKHLLIGTLLGDGSLTLNNDCINPKFSCEHGIKQKDYCEYKFEYLKNLNMKIKHNKRKTIDTRTGIYYESYRIESLNNPYYLEIYNNLYLNKKKQINNKLLQDFNEVSLAFLFMDDGYKTGKSISIATQCFTKEELKLFINFLYNKFNLTFNIHNNNTIYLLKKDITKFIALILPYLHESMYYKIKF